MNLSHFFALNKGSHTIDGTLGIINVSNCAGNRSATGGGEFEVFVIELAALALADRILRAISLSRDRNNVLIEVNIRGLLLAALSYGKVISIAMNFIAGEKEHNCLILVATILVILALFNRC